MPQPPHARQPEERSTIILRPPAADIAGKVVDVDGRLYRELLEVTAKREAWDWGDADGSAETEK